MNLARLLTEPWPWYVAGPVIGLFVPALLLLGNKQFGVSGSFRHLCAATFPGHVSFFQYDWRRSGAWSLVFLAGIVAGGWVAGLLDAGAAPALAAATRADLARLGITDVAGLVPADLIGWRALLSARGLVCMVFGGALVGFGTAYAGGCTSGHCISGLADFQLPSLVAAVAFFTTGIAASRLLLPLILGGAP